VAVRQPGAASSATALRPPGRALGQRAPLVSVVLPTYNRAGYVAESLESCLRQTYPNLELIVVDDGSVDATEQIVRSYPDARIRYLRKHRNEGLPEALNTGFALASGDYLTWTSDDNRYAPEAIETMLGFLEAHPEVDFVYAGMYRIDEQGHCAGRWLPGPPAELYKENRVGACFLYRRRVYEVIGRFDPRYTLAEDYEYWLRVMQQFRMCALEAPLLHYRRHKAALGCVYPEAVRAVTRRVRRDAARRWPLDKRMATMLRDSALGDLAVFLSSIRHGRLGLRTRLRRTLQGIMSLWNV